MSEKTLLVALNNGIPRIAAPLVCGDISGPGSLLGEEAPIPRPLRPVLPNEFAISPPLKASPHTKRSYESELAQNAVVLWEEGSANKAHAVEATTFLAGACSSALDLAWHLAEIQALFDWGSVLCTEQKQGRGQMRRAWHSPRGNMYAAFLLPKCPAFDHAGASVALGYLISKSLQNMGFTVQLKWPNDILTHTCQKIGGILLEERNGQLMAGLGINLEEAPSRTLLRDTTALPATVLPIAAKNDVPDAYFTPFGLWQGLVKNMQQEYSVTIAHSSPNTVFALADKVLAYKGAPCACPEERVEGRCLGLGPDGGLVIQTVTGHVEIFSGSVVYS